MYTRRFRSEVDIYVIRRIWNARREAKLCRALLPVYRVLNRLWQGAKRGICKQNTYC